MFSFRLPQRLAHSSPVTSIGSLRVTSDFAGGNAADVRVLSPADIRFSAAAGTSPKPLWFFFCLENAEVSEVRCELRNASKCYGPPHGWINARPVYSSDGETWNRVASATFHPGTGTFSFQVPIRSRRVYVAFCYPYTFRDLRRLLRELPPAAARVATLARTAEKAEVPLVEIGRASEPAIWIIARQHAGESPASWVAEGLIRQLVETAAGEDRSFKVVPIVDVDGVEGGRFGKDQLPLDFNRDWRAAPHRPEVAALVSAMAADRPALVLDLHASHNGDEACYLFGSPSSAPSKVLAVERQLADLLSQEDGVAGFRPTDLRPAIAPPESARRYLQEALAVPALTLEISYHLSQRGHYLTLSDYLQLGGALARALCRLYPSLAEGKKLAVR